MATSVSTLAPPVTETEENVRSRTLAVEWPIYAVVFASTCIAIIFGCWSVAGYRAGTASAGWVAGCWSGIICVLIKVTCAFVLSSTPLPGEQFRHVLSGSVQHLLEGPVIGAILGATGGLTARLLSKPRSSTSTLGLAGGK